MPSRRTLSALALLAVLGSSLSTATATAASKSKVASKKGFSVAAKPSAIVVKAGATVKVKIALKRTNFKSPISFAADNPLTGVVATIGNVSANSATLTVRADTSVASQSGQIAVNASGGGLSKQVLVGVTISGTGAPVAASPPATAAPPPPSTPPAPTTAGPTTIAVTTTAAPFVTNGPGRKLDFVVLENNSQGVTYKIALAKGDGTFDVKPTNLTNKPGPAKVLLGDLNADALSDLVVLFDVNGNDVISTYINKGGGQFDEKVSVLGLGPSGNVMTMGDINGDGRSDLVIVGRAVNNARPLSVAYSKGDGAFDTKTTNANAINPVEHLKVADVTGDGRNDIIMFESIGNGAGRIMVGVTTSPVQVNFTEAHTGPLPIGHPVFSVGFDVGDVDGDGQAEAMAVIPNGKGANMFLIAAFDKTSKKFIWGPTNLTATQTGPMLYIGDVTGDGRGDLLTNSSGGLSVGTFVGTGFDLKLGQAQLPTSANLGDLG